jgi:hypothetical protein
VKLPLLVVFIGSMIFAGMMTVRCLQATCGSSDQRMLWIMLSLTVVGYAAFAREGR